MITCSCGSTSIRLITMRSGANGRMVVKCKKCHSHKSIKGKLFLN